MPFVILIAFVLSVTRFLMPEYASPHIIDSYAAVSHIFFGMMLGSFFVKRAKSEEEEGNATPYLLIAIVLAVVEVIAVLSRK